MATDIFSKIQEKLLAGNLEEASALLRMGMPGLANELKEEWRECEKYCKDRRKENWDNRKITSVGSLQGTSKGNVHQERMKLPRLAQWTLDKQFGAGNWLGQREAMEWAWKKWPQFRLIDDK